MRTIERNGLEESSPLAPSRLTPAAGGSSLVDDDGTAAGRSRNGSNEGNGHGATPQRVPPEAEAELRGTARADAVRSIIGHPDPRSAGLPMALRRETRRYWRRYVEPLISRHWPEVRETPFYRKFQIGAQNVYAPAPYTVVVVSPHRPLVLRVFNRVCSALRLPRGFIVFGMKLMLPVFAWLLLRRENHRIVRMAAFIALVDEAFDNHMDDIAPAERGALLRKVLRGEAPPPNKPFALVRALRVALEEGASDDEKQELERAMEGCVAWGEAEVRNMLGEPDPDGLCHRKVGILTGIDGLAWTVRRHVGAREHGWMYDVSEFIQMLDDWVDLEKDAREGLTTPAHTGVWTLESIQRAFDHTSDTVADIVRDNGERYEPYVALARDSYRYQVADLLGLMLKGVAD